MTKTVSFLLLSLFLEMSFASTNKESILATSIDVLEKSPSDTFEAYFQNRKKLEKVKILRANNLGNYGFPAGNYSGITPIGGNKYAIVDDKSDCPGFYIFHLDFSLKSGKLISAKCEGFFNHCNPIDNADNEDIVFVKERNSVFITSETYQTISEYSLNGEATGTCLSIPKEFSKESIQNNLGFESLAYDSISQTYWTTTESSLKNDSNLVDSRMLLRLLQFNKDLQMEHQYAYLMERSQLNKTGKIYAHGVVAMLADKNGRLLVMEREASVPSKHIGATTSIKIFSVTLPLKHPFSFKSKFPLSCEVAQKKEIVSFTTKLKIGKIDFANYEGMCWGPTLIDGRRTLLLIADSQNRMGNSIVKLKDNLKVIILPKNY